MITLRQRLLLPVIMSFPLIALLCTCAGTEEFLNKSEKQVLIKIARDTLNLYLNKNALPGLSDYPLTANLGKECGVFVTLKNKKDGELRRKLSLCNGITDCFTHLVLQRLLEFQ